MMQIEKEKPSLLPVINLELGKRTSKVQAVQRFEKQQISDSSWSFVYD